MQGTHLRYLGQNILYFLQVFDLEFYQDSTFRLFWAVFFKKTWFRQSIESDTGCVLHTTQPLRVVSIGYFTGCREDRCGQKLLYGA